MSLIVEVTTKVSLSDGTIYLCESEIRTVPLPTDSKLCDDLSKVGGAMNEAFGNVREKAFDQIAEMSRMAREVEG